MQRLINIGLILSLMICYMEWGKGSSIFIYQAEYELFLQKNRNTDNFTHPLILAPFLGQLLLAFTLFQKSPSRRITLIGIILMGLLVFFISLSGWLSLNIKTIASTLPFIILTIIHFAYGRKNKAVKN